MLVVGTYSPYTRLIPNARAIAHSLTPDQQASQRLTYEGILALGPIG